MNLDQNETTIEQRAPRGEFREMSKPVDVFSQLATRKSKLKAFTLTELLVVIAIIAILSALGIPAAMNAINKSKQAAITLELKQIEQAVEEFKNQYGAYPPNGMGNNTYFNFSQDDFIRMFRKAFPRNAEPPELIQGLAGQGSLALLSEGDPDKRGMNGAEAVVFWLGGFSSDPKYPISGPGGPSFNSGAGEIEDIEGRSRLYDFDLGRLGPRNDNGDFDGRYLSYNVTVNGTTQDRRINLWFYFPSNSQQPYAYFDTSRHRALTETAPNTFENNYDPWFGEEEVTPGNFVQYYALKRANESNPNRIEFVNNGKFQILHAGLDDTWGNLTVFRIGNSGDAPSSPPLYPDGPFVGDIADTVANFMTGTLEDEQE